MDELIRHNIANNAVAIFCVKSLLGALIGLVVVLLCKLIKSLVLRLKVLMSRRLSRLMWPISLIFLGSGLFCIGVTWLALTLRSEFSAVNTAQQSPALSLGDAAAELLKYQENYARFRELSDGYQVAGEQVLAKVERNDPSAALITGKSVQALGNQAALFQRFAQRDFPQVHIEQVALNDIKAQYNANYAYILDIRSFYVRAIEDSRVKIGVHNPSDPRP